MKNSPDFRLSAPPSDARDRVEGGNLPSGAYPVYAVLMPPPPEEGAALLRQLDSVQDFQRHCPHGRPILCTLPFSDLEQRLGR